MSLSLDVILYFPRIFRILRSSQKFERDLIEKFVVDETSSLRVSVHDMSDSRIFELENYLIARILDKEWITTGEVRQLFDC